jgi:hypothetical protein
MSDFGRQPQPVKITLEGDPIDVIPWMRALMRRAESSGDMAQKINDNSFMIYPRAVND